MTEVLASTLLLSKRRATTRQLLRILGPLLALVVILVGFGIAVQIRGGLREHQNHIERAERLSARQQPVPAIPSTWQCIREHENTFLTRQTFRSTANQTVAVGIAAMGMTMIIISGGIDLSVGSVIALTCVVTSLVLRSGGDPLLAAVVAIGAGGLCGLANAGMVTGLRVVPFIATLGMWGMARGLAKGLADETTVYPPESWLSESILVNKPDPAWLLVSPGVWTMIALAIAIGALLRYTSLGRHIYALGSNEATARLCGIHVGRTKLMLYAIAGLTTGLAGVMQFSRLTVGDPTTANGTELDVIAAVVIGGGSLSGGEGSIFGSLIGALVMAFLRVGCTHVDLPSWVQQIVIGAVIVIAVAIDVIRRRSANAG